MATKILFLLFLVSFCALATSFVDEPFYYDHYNDDEYIDRVKRSQHRSFLRDGLGTESLDDAVDKGNICEVKNLYHVPVAGHSNTFHWAETLPVGMGLGDKWKTKKEREAFAIVQFYKHDDSEKQWITNSIQINSAKVQRVLEKVLEGYPGLTQHELDAFSVPFHPFVHRWETFNEKIEREKDKETRAHLELLRDALAPRLLDNLTRADEARSTGHVAWLDLPLVFKPEETAVGSPNGFRAAGTIRRGEYRVDRYGKKYFGVMVDVLDWDGRRCGLMAQEWPIYEYRGLRAFSALNVAPLELHPDKEILRSSLIQRGRVFERLRGQQFMAYTDEHAERINERTMIDARAYHKFSQKEGFPEFAALDEIGHLTWDQSRNRYSSLYMEHFSSPMGVDLTPLTDEQCLLAVPTVKSFNIETKKWMKQDLTKFHEIPWSKNAFEDLVLDPDEKDLLIALVDREELVSTKAFDDFIAGKGQGIVMLLSGPPGVGKTLTAESVAEHLKRPLFRVGAGELGITAHSVERYLETALKLCAHWGAVLLIDEADVFMEARSADNLQRNELVSVFLRHLEYYRGIMILTTNRLRSLDSAFESRIDISLPYDPLTEEDRRLVWRNFFHAFDAEDLDIEEDDITELAKWDFNGRQIKSAIKTARILAAKKQQPLNKTHLSVVLNLRAKALKTMDEDNAKVAFRGTEIQESQEQPLRIDSCCYLEDVGVRLSKSLSG
ncbi:P-loop containing nucleoside triphosphate hydrolase protein [Clohesyomyces aquaticus]|uniref:p-loop containing nucleoside triphosphate hydrolase protein n=1 Tax=Clohesyomyces aquaticus TaxID=1231657 RepID=A0A1Y1Z2Y7_9PLEO|nr:P-loop containing nucleoside triphosphate hydrolase protein [Clohesyomyces aquaticus]